MPSGKLYKNRGLWPLDATWPGEDVQSKVGPGSSGRVAVEEG